MNASFRDSITARKIDIWWFLFPIVSGIWDEMSLSPPKVEHTFLEVSEGTNFLSRSRFQSLKCFKTQNFIRNDDFCKKVWECNKFFISKSFFIRICFPKEKRNFLQLKNNFRSIGNSLNWKGFLIFNQVLQWKVQKTQTFKFFSKVLLCLYDTLNREHTCN